MPTVILLDVSLSMSRPVLTLDPTENHTRLTVAAAAINSFLDFLSMHSRLEYVALVTFSSICEVAVPFTRDFENIRLKLPLLEEGDKTCLDLALAGVSQLILSEWGYQTPVQIIVVTDGNIGGGSIGRSRIIQGLPLPAPYPVRIHVLPIASPADPCLTHAMPLYQKIVDLATSANNSSGNVSRGSIYCLDQLTVTAAITSMSRLCEQHYQEFTCTLKCGQLEARVQLFPEPHPAVHEGYAATYTLSNELNIIGFVHQNELGTPIAVSKHLVVPQAQNGNSSNRENYGSKTPTKDGSSIDGSSPDEEVADPSKIANFCVLLHGALKASRARRSCLLLCVLRPGAAAAPWLGPLDQLGAGDETSTSEAFPVRSWRSYSGGGAGCAWARPHALLADVQKELNRVRRAAISLGFSELVACVGAALERECAALPASAPPECSLQLAHAAAALRDPRTALDVKHTLQPLGPNFTVASMPH
ncbi:hypothetical protein MSG28_000401 [Choristoneura fumiferana]|uniref:Uncharacterized protein n=1 Tax=Choristoneura fumiferana TaxID=7141 RepID=A0ACC0K115_CHOFU|nr:hypothetical protein MSG28_000401 [Choristoneura fumiferana]